MQPVKLFRLREVLGITGIGKTATYEMIKQGLFPAPITVGKRAVAWVSTEIEQWIAERMAARGAR